MNETCNTSVSVFGVATSESGTGVEVDTSLV